MIGHVCLFDLAMLIPLWNAGLWSNDSENLHDETRHIAWHFGVDLVFLPFIISVLWSCEIGVTICVTPFDV